MSEAGSTRTKTSADRNVELRAKVRELKAYTEKIKRLIAEAPHADDCCVDDVTWAAGVVPLMIVGHCTCWKSRL